MKKSLSISILILLSATGLVSAQTYTLNGNIKDAENGETIPFANVFLKNDPTIGTTSNTYGYYSLSLEKGKHIVLFEFIGYNQVEKTIELNGPVIINVELKEAGKKLKSVVIQAQSENQSLRETKGSISRLTIDEIKELPAFGGEVDVIKTLQYTPGVTSAGEGNGGFNVRGGRVDQNLIQLDESTVYNPSHLLGVFSVFNADAIKNVTLYKGGIPAKYGGRASSVVDIRMKDGNMKKWKASLGLGILAGKATVEGPIIKEKGSMLITGRRTWADLLLKTADKSFQSNSLYFYDLNMKANYIINDKNRIYLSSYFGRDVVGVGDIFGINYGNVTGTLRWNHMFSNKLFSNMTAIVGEYQFQFEIGKGDEFTGLQSVIRDTELKQDLIYSINNNNELSFGYSILYKRVEPGNLVVGPKAQFQAKSSEKKNALEFAFYAQNEHKLTDKLTANYGMRISWFKQLAPITVYEFEKETGTRISKKYHTSSDDLASYYGIEPRLSVSYLLNDVSSLKLGYNRGFQYIHLLSNSGPSTPSDVWMMSSNNIKPQRADQVSLGYFRKLKDNKYELLVESYYKAMDNIIDYRNGADPFLNDEIEGDLLGGTGTSMGIEFQLKKKTGKFKGWISYTLSRTRYSIDQINNGVPFPAKQDKTHDLTVVGSYKIHPKWAIATNFLYATGQAVTYPSGRYSFGSYNIPYYTERNGYRFPDFQRLDISATWYYKKTEKSEKIISLSIYNVYNHANPWFVQFRQVKVGNRVETEAVQYSLFQIVPSLSYTWKF